MLIIPTSFRFQKALLLLGLKPMTDPRALLRQLQLQTQASRYAQLIKAANNRLVDRVVKK